MEDARWKKTSGLRTLRCRTPAAHGLCAWSLPHDAHALADFALDADHLVAPNSSLQRCAMADTSAVDILDDNLCAQPSIYSKGEDSRHRVP
jgi:hypothetical protein